MADHNLSAPEFPRWNAALAKAKLGTAPARIAFVGDSTMEGEGAVIVADALPGRMEALDSLGRDGTIYGLALDATDARVVQGTGQGFWGPTAFGSPGREFSAPTSATGNLSISFPGMIDTVRVYYAGSSVTGSFVVDVDGIVLGTVNTAGANFVSSATFTCTAGIHTINVRPPTVGTVDLLGIEAWLSTNPGVLYSNGGATGVQTSWYQSNGLPWNSKNLWNLFKPDLTIASLGINDCRIGGASYDPTVSAGYMTSIVAQAQAWGDILICSMIPSDPTAYTDIWPNEQALMPLLEAVAVAAPCGYVDLTLPGRFVDWNTANANGYMQDALHPNQSGYSFWASILHPILNSLTTVPGSGGAAPAWNGGFHN